MTFIGLSSSVNFRLFGSSCNHSIEPFVPYTLIFRPFSPPVAADDTQIIPLALFCILNNTKALSSTEISEDNEFTSADISFASNPVTYLNK